MLVPVLVGGQWAQDLSVSAPESPYLAFIVGLHVATAAALLVFFWRDWVRILVESATSIRHRCVRIPAERLAWLIIVATIPVGLSGLAWNTCSTRPWAGPSPAAAFLLANGAVLYLGERLRHRAQHTNANETTVVMGPIGVNGPGAAHDADAAADTRLGPRTQKTQPHPPTRSPRLQGHPGARGLSTAPPPRSTTPPRRADGPVRPSPA